MEKSHSASIGTDMAYFYSSPSLIYMLLLKLSSKNTINTMKQHTRLFSASFWYCNMVELCSLWYGIKDLPSMRYERSRNGPKQISHIIGRPSFYFYPKHLRPSFYFYPKHLHAEKTILSCLQMSLYLAFNKSIKMIKVSSVIQYCVLCFVFCCSVKNVKSLRRKTLKRGVWQAELCMGEEWIFNRLQSLLWGIYELFKILGEIWDLGGATWPKPFRTSRRLYDPVNMVKRVQRRISYKRILNIKISLLFGHFLEALALAIML